ncbi:MAG TPA: cytochrome c peroxidase [Verrucomicrobiae bacterium]|nr:cytochrome c peroxidase [Verrucomicrobiae bacterium]
MKPSRLFAFILMSIALAPAAALAAEADKTPYEIKFPLGVDPDVFTVPEDNPMSAAKVELGKMLYFDKRISANDKISCATCHNPEKGFTDQLPVSKGFEDKTGTRNAPTVINSAFGLFQFWDGRAATLEEQAVGPMQNPVEMAHTLDGAVQKINAVAGYKPYFEAAFGDSKVDIDRIAKAIAAYERTVLSGNSPWDRYVNAHDESAMSESAKRGLTLFEGKARCTQCHVGFNLSDGVFHNIGVGMKAPKPDLGRYEITKEEKDKGAFKTPILRDLQKTFPYMHDGSEKTLEEVVDFYDKGGEPNSWLDPKMQKLGLTKEEKDDLVAFLKSLEGDWTPAPEPTLPQ